MKRYLILVSMLLLVFLTSACVESQAATPSPDARQATFVVVENDVQARGRQRDDYQPAQVEQVLPLNGQARTGQNSQAQLNLLPDGSVVRMGPDTEFLLTNLNKEPSDLFARLELAAGQLWIILQGGELQVETELGVAAVRGSIMGVIYIPGVSLTVTCLEGTCRISNDYGMVEFTAGQAVDVPAPGQPPSIPRPMTPPEIDEWIGILRLTRSGPRLGDRVWLDIDQDGIQDPLEQGLAGVTVSLRDAPGDLIAETTTDGEGYYSFPLIQAGAYYLVFHAPGDHVFSPQDAGDDTLDSDPNALTGATTVFVLMQEDELKPLLDWDAGLIPVALLPVPTDTPTSTPEPQPCGCETPGVLFEIVKYDGSPGWSDCGQATACHSIIGSQLVNSGTVIGTDICSMRVTCPSP